MENYIVEEIIRLTGDPKSRAFWEKAVRFLGENTVAEEFSELKYQMQTKNIREPRKYLTTLLKAKLKTHEAEKNKQPPPAIPEKLKTYFEENQVALFSSLIPLSAGGEAERKEMEIPYSKETIPWATFMSSNFFTLSTNKAKSDIVQAKFRTADGEVTVIPMLRGRAKPKGEELGIPTVEHGRILAALENIWAQQGCPYHTYSDSKAVVCFCLVSIRELARLLGRTSFGGRDLVQLTNKVWNLKNMAYYLDLAAVGFKNAVNRGFSLLHSVELAEGMKHGQMETILKVEFSTQLSSQLLSRRAVSRPKQLAHIQSELGFLIRLYLEPILFSLSGEVYSKSLEDLIKDLALPAAPWHKYKSQRRRIFQKALKSMQNQKTTDGRGIILNIEEGLTDYLLTARLEPVALPAKVDLKKGGGMKKKKKAVYNPEVELAKGATLIASSYDKTQKIKVTAGKVTVGGIPGRAEISGIATGKHDTSIDGTIDLWLSIFRYMRPDGTIDHVGGWNIPTSLKPGQTPAATAKVLADYINAGARPYRAAAGGGKNRATIKIVFTVK